MTAEKGDASVLAQSVIPRILAGVAEIEGNLQYILREVRKMGERARRRGEIEQVCSEFESTIPDVNTEIRNLSDKLAGVPRAERRDPDMQNDDPRIQLGFIQEWLATRFEALNGLIRRLDDDANGGFENRLVYILVAESATNMLNAFNQILDAVDEIQAGLSTGGVES